MHTADGRLKSDMGIATLVGVSLLAAWFDA